jgi:hypothetical protein
MGAQLQSVVCLGDKSYFFPIHIDLNSTLNLSPETSFTQTLDAHRPIGPLSSIISTPALFGSYQFQTSRHLQLAGSVEIIERDLDALGHGLLALADPDAGVVVLLVWLLGAWGQWKILKQVGGEVEARTLSSPSGLPTWVLM